MPASPRHAHVRFTAPVLEAIEKDRLHFKCAGLAPRTILSYERDWRVFGAWCEAAGRTALPASAETVELYCADLIGHGRKISTLERHSIGIQYFHRGAGYPSPCGAELRALLSGARRTLCQMPSQKLPIGAGDLRRMVKAIGRGSAIQARNCALLVFGFASALRRSNLAGLLREDLTFSQRGIIVTVRHEKQDRSGAGRLLAVSAGRNPATDPVRVLRRWLKFRGDQPGPLFTRVLNGHADGKAILGNRIAQIVQDAVAAIGLDRRKYGAHSLRAGFVTEALERGVNEIAIARQTGHRSLDTLRLYMRSRDPFRGNAGGMVGL
jgi:integrase